VTPYGLLEQADAQWAAIKGAPWWCAPEGGADAILTWLMLKEAGFRL
jgi:hypothetical protein